ncbi:MAG: hypothetical protein QOJ16_5063 [Acidobacteriota bacterium]|jgi:mannan endo-1,4-beta-mannosidase|nr:hypothetical protein [Acidobacteriota bacterium]
MSSPSTVLDISAPPAGPAPLARDSRSAVRVAPGRHYFMTGDGSPFLLIGHNDAICWPNLAPLRAPGGREAVLSHLRMLAAQGVTVLRLMLEYGEDRDWFFEDPIGCPLPHAVRYWDDLIGLCERTGIRLLLAFWDTFHLSARWELHPYSRPGSGFDAPGCFCTSETARAIQRERVRFCIERWGGSPAIFGYDLLNEMHPAWGGGPEEQHRWISEMADFVRTVERERWGHSHLLTVSTFGGILDEAYQDLILRHPSLDFASTHVYEFGAIDNPDNTIDGALAMRDAVRFALASMREPRPYTDSEHGPIHLFMDHKRQLPEAFDAEYFHNLAWAHLASGGAGGGMRWPFRDPHILTSSMHAVQGGLARFAGALDWNRFAPRPIDLDLYIHPPLPILPFGCADDSQGLVWLLRDLRRTGATPAATPLAPPELLLPELPAGRYRATFWDTWRGRPSGERTFQAGQAGRQRPRLPLPPFERDLAITFQAERS